MFKILTPAVAVLGLVAFAAQTKDAAEDAPAAATFARGAATAPAMGWHVSQEGAIAKLAYGVENSDQLALMVTCAPGDAVAVIYGDVQPVSPRLIPASLGPAPTDALSGGDAYETRIPVRDAALRGLADNGGMTVLGEAGTFRLTATPQERRVVDGFLAYCGGERA